MALVGALVFASLSLDDLLARTLSMKLDARLQKELNVDEVEEVDEEAGAARVLAAVDAEAEAVVVESLALVYVLGGSMGGTPLFCTSI